MRGHYSTQVPEDADETVDFPMGPLIFAAVGSLYVLGSAPGLTWLDAGELAAASHELGIAHPPGLPLFSLFNKCVAFAIPVGDIAFRGNLASAILSALTLAFCTQIMPITSVVARVCAVLLVATVPLVVLHSTTVEVYAGVALLTVLAMACLYRTQVSSDHRWTVLAALIFGLGIGGHHAEIRLFTLGLLIPVVVRSGSVRVWLSSATAGVVGVMVLLYLPLRSLTDPWRNWGDPSTPSALWDHFWGARIRAAYGSEMGSLDTRASMELWGQLALDAPFLVVLGLAGIVLALKHTGGWVLLAALVIDVSYSLLINPMGIRDMQNGFISVITLGAGAAVCLESLIHRWRQSGITWALCGVSFLACWFAFGGFTHREDRGLDRLVNRVTSSSPPEAMALVASDNLAAGLAYAQVVQGARPDVAVVVRQHVQYASSTGPTARRLPDTMAGWRPGTGLDSLNALTHDWPVEWEWAGGTDGRVRPKDLKPHFPMFSSHGPGRQAF